MIQGTLFESVNDPVAHHWHCMLNLGPILLSTLIISDDTLSSASDCLFIRASYPRYSISGVILGVLKNSQFKTHQHTNKYKQGEGLYSLFQGERDVAR